MAHKDYYKILDLDRNASQQEIKKRFRKLARQYHPDVSQESQAKEKFNNLAEAYEVLNDPERRKLYDQGHIDQAWFANQSFENIRDIFEASQRKYTSSAPKSSIPDNQTQKKDAPKSRFKDFFNQIVDSVNLGGREQEESKANPKAPNNAKSSTQNTALNLEQTLQITLTEAFLGARKPVNIQQDKLCVLCGGKGRVSNQACRHCQGKGRVKAEKRLEVKIPAGVRTGSKIRVSNEGLMRGQEQGDLFLLIQLKPHAFFEVEADGDLHCQLPITVTEAVLGTELEIPTLGGRVKIKIPAGTQGGQTFRLRGKGLKNIKDKPSGDLYASAQIIVPKNLSTNQQKQYRDLFESGDALRKDLI